MAVPPVLSSTLCVVPRTISREGALGLLHNRPLTPRAATAAPPPVRPASVTTNLLVGRGWDFTPEWRASEVLSGRGARHVRTFMRAPRLLADAAGACQWLAIIAAEGGPWARDFASPSMACPLCCQQPGPAAERAGRRRSPQRLRALPASRSGSPGGGPTLAREASLRSSFI